MIWINSKAPENYMVELKKNELDYHTAIAVG